MKNIKMLGQTLTGLAFFIAVPFTLLLHGQNTAEQESSGARLLDFTVVAVDNHGQPVTDLTSDDFQVADNGKRQQIAWFHPAGSKSQMPVAAAGELSNRSAATNNLSANRPVTFILFDLLNERFGTRAITANQMIRDLQKIDHPDGLYLYILTVEGRIFAVHGLTGHGAQTDEPGDRVWTSGIKPLLERALNTVTQVRAPSIDLNVRVGMTLNSLATVAAQLSAFPGRKNLVWVTDGIPLAISPRNSDTGIGIDFTSSLRQLSENFDRAQTAIYPVQEKMLSSDDIESRATLDEMASLTGGRPTGSKDIFSAVTQAMNDSAGSYQIGYFAGPKTFDGKFHKLKITTARKGVRIQARSGYYAVEEPATERAARAIQSASANPADAGEIQIAGSVTPDPQNADRAHAAFRINANDIALPQQDRDYTGELTIALLAYQADGRVSSAPPVPLNLHFSAAQRDDALKNGISFAQDVGFPKDAAQLRLIVFDRDSNTIGSLTIPLHPVSRTN